MLYCHKETIEVHRTKSICRVKARVGVAVMKGVGAEEDPRAWVTLA